MGDQWGPPFLLDIWDTLNSLSDLEFNVKEWEKRKIAFHNKQIENK